MDRRDACLDILLYGSDNIDRIAVTVVRVRNDRHRDGVRNIARVQMHFGHCCKAAIGHAGQRERCAISGHIDGRKPDFVEDFAADRVVATGNDDGFARLHHLAEFCGTSHFVRPFLT